ncbi:hypothetical protein F4803DRAFT_568504 [Xylaria telfairii]|nr:hypothetical protein F4803DRAFT_568504 [Xylaria telfairii]
MGSNSDSTNESAASSAPDNDRSDAQRFELQYTVLKIISRVIFHNTNCKENDQFLYIKATLDEFLRSYGMNDILGITSNVIAFDSNPRHSPTTKQNVLDKKVIHLLYQLHTISKDLPPPWVQQSVSTHNVEGITADKNHVFNYHMKIDQKVGQVRVIKLLPGSENDPIKCHLTLCDVLVGAIEEALSYVWGTGGSEKNLLVSQQSYPEQPFPVRDNLYEILHSLRLSDATRTLWIDAICIDQWNHEKELTRSDLCEIYTLMQKE